MKTVLLIFLLIFLPSALLFAIVMKIYENRLLMLPDEVDNDGTEIQQRRDPAICRNAP